MFKFYGKGDFYSQFKEESPTGISLATLFLCYDGYVFLYSTMGKYFQMCYNLELNDSCCFIHYEDFIADLSGKYGGLMASTLECLRRKCTFCTLFSTVPEWNDSRNYYIDPLTGALKKSSPYFTENGQDRQFYIDEIKRLAIILQQENIPIDPNDRYYFEDSTYPPQELPQEFIDSLPPYFKI